MKLNHTLLTTLLLSTASCALAAGTPAGTKITNQAYLTSYTSEDPNVPPTTITSNPVTTTVVHVPGIDGGPDSPGTPTNPTVPTDPTNALQCGQSVVGIPGENAVLTYRFTNTSNGTDTYNLTTNVISGTPNNVTYYIDNGDNVFDSNDAPAGINLTLDSDESVTLFAVFPIPSTVAGGQGFSLSPVVTSQANAQVYDANNYGCIVTQNIYGITLTPNNESQADSPSTVTYTHTLTNIGNTPLDTRSLAFTQQSRLGWVTRYQIAGGAAYPTLNEALAAARPLGAGQSTELTVTTQVPAGLSGGTTDTITITASVTPDAANVSNANLSPTPVTVTDITTVVSGQGEIGKVVESCGTDETCAAPVSIPQNEVRPGEVLRYTIEGSNAGGGGLRGVSINDPLPQWLIPLNYSAELTLPQGVQQTGTLLYSVNNTNWATTAPSLTGLNQPTLYVGYDSNGNGTIDYTDILPAGARITMTVTAKVQ